MPRYRILIVDDHPAICHGVAQMFQATADLEVCGEAPNRETMLNILNTAEPDAAIVDIFHT